MKECRFNYFVKDRDNVICLNGISGNVFAVGVEAFQELKTLLTYPDNMDNNQDLVQSLYALRFLVDDDFQEIEFLKQRYKKAINTNYYHLTINPTQECNFRCWYCYESHTTGHMSSATMKNIEAFIGKTLSRSDINAFELSWFGGEPLLYFDEIVYPLSVYTKEQTRESKKTFTNSMTTNGYYLNKSVIAKCDEIDLRLLQITLDGNRELHNRTRNENGLPSFDRILENIIAYCFYSVHNSVILRVNYTDEVIRAGLKDVLALIPREIRSQIRVNFQRVWQTVGKEKSTTDVLDHMKCTKDMGFVPGRNTAFSLYRGRLCYADSVNYVNVNFDGNVYRCTANEYDRQNRLGYLDEQGDIIWDCEETLNKVFSTPTFENEMCLKCKNLAICGGFCFKRRMDLMYSSQSPSCVKKKMDTGVDTFVREYYETRLKKRQERKIE